jgi:TNF receptor-associated protein 1
MTTTSTAPESHAFQADVGRILDIVVHSLYKDREIFLRELVSNASDALEKVRHIKLTEPAVNDTDAELAVIVTTDKDAGTITITDTGLGMTREELVNNLGTIAHSGTKAFLEALKNKGNSDTDNLIGRFGVGFFSVFMVAGKVSLTTRSWRPGAESLTWTSDGRTGYEIATGAESQPRGTTLVITLLDDHKEFADKERLRGVLDKHSKYVPFPLTADGDRVNTQEALWLRSKASIKDEEYAEFYKFHCHAWDDAVDHVHFAADAPIVINALLYVPSHNPEKMGFGRLEAGVTLHCRKILIDAEPKGLLPDWARFLKGVVDSADLPLNISREMLQDSALVQKLNRVVTKRVIKHLDELSKKDAEKFKKFWAEFGILIKEGIVTDHTNRDALAPLLRFESSSAPAGTLVSLDDYTGRMRDGQKGLYYLAGADRASIEAGPYLEAFKARGLEVLFVYEGADEFVFSHLGKFKDKEILAGDRDDLDLGDATSAAEGEPLAADRVSSLCAWIKDTLGAAGPQAVAAGDRLVGSPAVALNTDKHASPGMRQMMRAMRKDDSPAPSASVKLELNPRHVLVKQLDSLRERDAERAKLVAEQLYDNALLAAGLLDNPRLMVARLNKLLEAMAK